MADAAFNTALQQVPLSTDHCASYGFTLYGRWSRTLRRMFLNMLQDAGVPASRSRERGEPHVYVLYMRRIYKAVTWTRWTWRI